MEKNKKIVVIVTAVPLIITILLSMVGCQFGVGIGYSTKNVYDTTTVEATKGFSSIKTSTAITDPGETTTEGTPETTKPSTLPTEPTIEATATSPEATTPTTEVTQPSTESSKPTEAATEPTVRPTEPMPTEHRHSYSSMVTAPTCTAEGHTVYTCGCGDSYTTDKVPAKGHKWGEWVEVKTPTTFADGTAERKCSVCSTKEIKTLDKLVEIHTHSYSSSVTTVPTCTQNGVKTYTCSCGSSYTESVPATGHDYATSVVVPTCTSNGYTVYKCSICGWCEHGNYVEETGHTYSGETVVEPSCTEAGHTLLICSVCGHHEYIDFVQPTGHEYTWDFSTDGRHSSICNNCGITRTLEPDTSTAGQEALEYINQYRQAEGLAPLTYYWEAQEIANIRAVDLIVVFSHTRPDGSSFMSLVWSTSYDISSECLAGSYFSTAKAAVDAWMASTTGHREVLMSPTNTHVVLAHNEGGWVLLAG